MGSLTAIVQHQAQAEVGGAVSSCPVVVCSADSRYAGALAVMLVSLGANLKRYPAVHVMVLDCGVGWRHRRKVQASIDSQKIHLEWIRFDRHVLKGLPLSGHIKPAAYARLLIPRLLPATICKIIYLDVDIVVNADIGELWDMPMGNCPLLAAQDGQQVVSDPAGLALYRELGIAADAKYLNSGVLVMDLRCWRDEHIAEAIFDYLRAHHIHVIWHDQDGINAVLAGRWLDFGNAWNYRVDCGCPEESLNAEHYRSRLLREARLIHYASTIKPWHKGVSHPAVMLFTNYLDLTAYKGWQSHPVQRKRWLQRHAVGAMLRKLPLLGNIWASWRENEKVKIKE